MYCAVPRVGLPCEKIAKQSVEPHKLRRRRSLIAADSAARHILLLLGGVAHSRLAAAEFGDSRVYSFGAVMMC